MAFPSNNLHLSTVLQAYGVTTMNALRGRIYYNSDGTSGIIPTNGNFSLSLLFNKWSLNPAPLLDQPITTLPIPLPVNRPTPVRFSITLQSGGGGGGGGGGGYISYGGGAGGGGGGASRVTTQQFNYDPASFATIFVTLSPTIRGGPGGGGGFGGNNTSDGSAGSRGGDAGFGFSSPQFTSQVGVAIRGGAGGGPGFRGQGGGAGGNGSGGAGGVISVTPSNVVFGSQGGVGGSGQTPGSIGGGAGGSGAGNSGGGGIGGSGLPGFASISWIFVP